MLSQLWFIILVGSVDQIGTKIRGRRTHLPVVLLRIRHSAEKGEGELKVDSDRESRDKRTSWGYVMPPQSHASHITQLVTV